MREPWLVGYALALALASACVGETEAGPAPAPGGLDRDTAVDLGHDLALIAIGVPASAADLAQLEQEGFSRAAYTRFIDVLLRRPQLGGMAGRVLGLRGAPDRYFYALAFLKVHQDADGKPTYYLHQPCEP